MFQTQLLFYILMLLLLGAVIAFSYTVVKPLQTRWAVKRGREIAASGDIKSRWQFENTYRMLATAPNDLEAAYLWHKLKEIKERTQTQD
ncbi:MAG: hypothetical protein V1691_01820 [Chloroflexota bacterium]